MHLPANKNTPSYLAHNRGNDYAAVPTPIYCGACLSSKRICKVQRIMSDFAFALW